MSTHMNVLRIKNANIKLDVLLINSKESDRKENDRTRKSR